MSPLGAWLETARLAARERQLLITEIPGDGDRPIAYLVMPDSLSCEADSPINLGVWIGAEPALELEQGRSVR